MRRLVTWCLVSALVEMAGLAASLHTHEYVEHDHPEHHHGLAAHEHHDPHAQAAAHDAHGGATWTRCDPAAHKSAVKFTSVATTTFHLVLADVDRPVVQTTEPRTGPRVIPKDVRVHGPPIGRETPPRAPPVIASQSIT